jgi:uncharacterized membrane protein required for colicin V production
LIDIGVLVLVLLMAVYGYYTGIVRRVIGFLGIYAGYFVASNAGYAAAPVIRQAYPSWSQEDALMAGYFGLVVLIFVVVEVMASFIHRQLQFSIALLDKPSGAVIGVISILLGITAGLALLLQATTPSGFVQPDSAQTSVRESIRGSVIGAGLVSSLGHPVLLIFAPVTPSSPDQYFNYSASKTVTH